MIARIDNIIKEVRGQYPVLQYSFRIILPASSPPSERLLSLKYSNTYLSPTLVVINSISLFLQYSNSPRLLSIVPTIVFLFNLFLFFRSLLMIASV